MGRGQEKLTVDNSAAGCLQMFKSRGRAQWVSYTHLELDAGTWESQARSSITVERSWCALTQASPGFGELGFRAPVNPQVRGMVPPGPGWRGQS